MAGSPTRACSAQPAVLVPRTKTPRIALNPISSSPITFRQLLTYQQEEFSQPSWLSGASEPLNIG